MTFAQKKFSTPKNAMKRKKGESLISSLEDVYRNSSAAFSGAYAIYEEARKRNIAGVTLKRVKTFLSTKSAWIQQLRRPKKFRRSKIVAKDVNEMWESDLTFVNYSRGMVKSNRNHKYLLVCICVLSKKVYVMPLKKKSGSIVAETFRKLMISLPQEKRPKTLRTDRGTEYTGQKFKEITKEFSIHHYFAHNKPKCAVVERFNRTLKESLFEAMTELNTKKWLDNGLLEQVVKNYNNKVHSTTGLAPNLVTRKEVPVLLTKIYGKYWKNRHQGKRFQFLLGDSVLLAKSSRVSTSKTFAGRTGQPVFESEIFKIAERILTPPARYKLIDAGGRILGGSFYAPELYPLPRENDIYELLLSYTS